MIHVQGLRRNVKNVVKNYSDAQVKVREATSNDPWGPSGTLMSEIADLTYNVVAFSEIMQVIWKRLNDHGKNWKHVYKALVLLEYLIKTGSEKVTQQCRENLFAIQTLRDFQYFEDSKDQGVNVREKAKQLVALLKDEERLKSERSRALKARERFARASAYTTKPDHTVPRPYGSSEFRKSSYDENMLSPGALSMSELEHARPQTAGEEELQLQLALAMSKEEADQAERLKRNDDLRLQMALSESEEEFKKHQTDEKPKVPQSSSAMDDLAGLNLNTNGNTTPSIQVDPWGLPLTTSSNTDTLDVWNTNIDVPEKNRNLVKNDPWSPALDNSNHVLQNSNLFASSQDNLSDSSAYDFSNMKKSLSADVNAVSSGNPSLDAYISNESSLLNFDQTVPRSRTAGETWSQTIVPPSNYSGNPFQSTRPSPLTINEMRAQNNPQTLTGPTENVIPTSNSMPLSSTLFTNASYWNPNNVSPSRNPFL